MRRFFLMGCFAVLATVGFAQRVEVRKSGEGKILINLAGYKTGRDATSKTFLSVLKADLNRSGYFKVTSIGAEVNVVGSCSVGSQLKAGVQVYKVSTRQRVLGKNYNAPAGHVRGLAHSVSDEIVYAVTGKKGMATGKIALVSNRTKKKELYICDMDGKNLRQITKDRSIVVGPSWAPGGKSVVYTSYKRGYPNIYLTGRSKPLSSHAGLNASGAISPDGKSLALILSKDGNPELYIKSLRTGALKRLTHTQTGNEATPSWSPDGNQLAYVSDRSGRPQIYIISKNGGAAKRISSSGGENVAPDWGRNGYLAYSSRIGGRYQIVIAHPGNRSMRVLETDWADYEDPSWAPDGRHIICSRTANYRSSIYLLDTLKDSPVALISGSSNWYSPACSP